MKKVNAIMSIGGSLAINHSQGIVSNDHTKKKTKPGVFIKWKDDSLPKGDRIAVVEMFNKETNEYPEHRIEFLESK